MSKTIRESGIVWIASYPKSGTTWVRIFLYNLVNIMRGREAELNANSLAEFAPWDVAIAAQEYRRIHSSAAPTCSLQEILPLRIQSQAKLAKARGGIVFVKTQWALGQFLGYSSLNHAVTRGAIYIVRNPLDVVISMSHFFNWSIEQTIEHLGRRNASLRLRQFEWDLLGSWSDNIDSWTRESSAEIFVVRYEDLLSDPEIWFSAMCHHIFADHPPTSLQVRNAIELSSFENLKTREIKHGWLDRPGQFFREGRAGQWKNNLTNKQIDRLVATHHEQMTRFGYLPLTAPRSGQATESSR